MVQKRRNTLLLLSVCVRGPEIKLTEHRLTGRKAYEFYLILVFSHGTGGCLGRNENSKEVVRPESLSTILTKDSKFPEKWQNKRGVGYWGWQTVGR